MSEHILTLKGLLWGDQMAKQHGTHAAGNHVERHRRGWGEQVDAMLHENLLKEMRKDALMFAHLAPRSVREEALDTVASTLDKSLGDILTSAWVTLPSLQAAANPMRHRHDETIMVPLDEHTISWKQEPALDFTCDGIKVYTVQFAVSLELQISPAVLRVRDGRIREFVSGTCDADTKLFVADIKLAERKIPKISLPLSVPLGAGIRIPLPPGVRIPNPQRRPLQLRSTQTPDPATGATAAEAIRAVEQAP